jgi:hypothetical protein
MSRPGRKNILADAMERLAARYDFTETIETGGTGSSGGYAPYDATYVTLSTNALLTSERVLTDDGSILQLVDGGAGSTVTIGWRNQNANLVLAGPAAAPAAAPTFRALVYADLPDLGAAPALSLSTSNAEGSAASFVRTDATVALFDATTPADVAAAGATGSAGVAARRDHVHAHPAGLGADLHHAGFIGLEDNAGTPVTPALDDRIQILAGSNITVTAGTNTLTIAHSGAVTAHDLLSATHGDTTPNAVTRGSMIYADSTPKWTELGHPAGAGYALTTDANDVYWDLTPTWTGAHTHQANVVLDDGVGNSPRLRMISGTNDDTADLFLVDSAIAGESDVRLILAGATTGARFVIFNTTPEAVFRFTGQGEMFVGGQDSVRGQIQLYSEGTLSDLGGLLLFHVAADYDTAFASWNVDANQDDLRVFSSDAASIHYFRAGGNVELAANLQLNTDGSWAGLGAASARLVFNAAGSEASLRSAGDFVLYASADTATETLRLDGLTGSVYVIDGSDVGVSGAIRLTFNTTASPDRAEITGGDLYFATGTRGITHAAGNTAGMVLQADGTRYLPVLLGLDHLVNTSLSDPNADRIVFWDDSDGQYEWLIPGSGLSITINTMAVDHDAADNFVANEHVDHSAVTITAGDGLTGGGDITTTRTLTLGTPSTLTVSTTNTVTASSHTHAMAASAAVSTATTTLLKSDASGRLRVMGLGLGAAAGSNSAVVFPDGGWVGLSTDHRILFDAATDDAIYFITASGGGYVAQLYHELANDRAILRLDPQGDYDDCYLAMEETTLLNDATGNKTTFQTSLSQMDISAGSASYLVIKDGDLRIPSGLYVGSTATAPSDGHVRATAFVSGFLPFASYDATDLFDISAAGTLLASSLAQSCTLRYMYVSVYVATTNDGSNYWTINLKNQAGTTRATINTSSGVSVATWTSKSHTGLSVSLTVAADKLLYIECVKTGSPGNLSLGCPAVYVE